MSLLDKIRLKMQGKTNLRNTIRIVGGFFAGILSGILASWIVFFVLIIVYCFFEFIIHFNHFRSRILHEKRLVHFDEDPPMHIARTIKGESSSIAFSISIKKFLKSFILMSVIGIIIKILTEFFIFL